ncbi:MAG: DUF4398 domain-containing protein [Bdellovibrionales bacterium]
MNFTYGCAVFILCASCVGRPPIKNYTLARTAIEAARKVDGLRYSPEVFHRAEEFYRKGEIYYKNHEYANAESAFEEARLNAEKAENEARMRPTD